MRFNIKTVSLEQWLRPLENRSFFNANIPTN
nr:MAG TPA: hypothetical protein [Caudoviricetes sp.]